MDYKGNLPVLKSLLAAIISFLLVIVVLFSFRMYLTHVPTYVVWIFSSALLYLSIYCLEKYVFKIDYFKPVEFLLLLVAITLLGVIEKYVSRP